MHNEMYSVCRNLGSSNCKGHFQIKPPHMLSLWPGQNSSNLLEIAGVCESKALGL